MSVHFVFRSLKGAWKSKAAGHILSWQMEVYKPSFCYIRILLRGWGYSSGLLYCLIDGHIVGQNPVHINNDGSNPEQATPSNPRMFRARSAIKKIEVGNSSATDHGDIRVLMDSTNSISTSPCAFQCAHQPQTVQAHAFPVPALPTAHPRSFSLGDTTFPHS